MAADNDIARIQNHIANALDPSVIGQNKIAAVVGDRPSRYSKSPALWNAAFRKLNMHAVYLPLDADQAGLPELVSALRDADRFMGMNVTVPHKVKIMDLLDELDAAAERIGAVNTVVRTPAGRLIGHNSDGEGFIASILERQPGERGAFMKSLQGIDVLLLGAGGSARAVAFHLADLLNGQLIICNRTIAHAELLAREVGKKGSRATAIGEDALSQWAPKAGLLVNSTTKGQGGLSKFSDGKVTSLEAYSSLASASPPASTGGALEEQTAAAQADIIANHKASLALARTIPQSSAFYDLIYHPEETVFLRHGRETGHITRNGKAMIICQAVIAFCEKICKQDLLTMGMDDGETRRQVAEIMYAAWSS